jgi:hypothetical protein
MGFGESHILRKPGCIYLQLKHFFEEGYERGYCRVYK